MARFDVSLAHLKDMAEFRGRALIKLLEAGGELQASIEEVDAMVAPVAVGEPAEVELAPWG